MNNLKIISWNVNGLRATHRNGYFLPFVKAENPDILCLQEVKAEPEQLPEEIRNMPEYFSFFCHCSGKKGYSGVALYSKVKPDKVEYGMGGREHLDSEGRMIVAYYSRFILINIYFPNGGGGPERLQYKLDFYDAFLKFVEKLRLLQPNIIFCGDINTAHEEIDLARPKANEGRTGFLPEERAWIDEVEAAGFVDVFRHFYPNKRDAYTYWDMKTFARDRNVGWRIDYFFVSPAILPEIKSTKIMPEVYGSDHCPISLDLKI